MRDAGAGTVRQALEASTDALAAAGVESPRLDAELLLAEACGAERAGLALDPEAPVPATAARAFAAAVRRRVAREPVAYILGRKGFRHLELSVDSRALVPRPETELLVEVALEQAELEGSDPVPSGGSVLPEGQGSDPLKVLDVGTGSGAVALAIADELPEATIFATDLSPAAVELARENVDRLGFADRVRVELGSLPAGGRFDLLVANLPYVNEADWEGLEPEITRYEPREALVPGPAGLEAIESLLGGLALGGCEASAVALEVGAGQAPAVAELVRRAGYDRTGVRHDLAGIERVVVGRR